MKDKTKLTPEEYKNEVKKVLKYFHNFCIENGLEYYIAYGSLLGTIRHKGFIPWDDDIDVYMLRSEYEKLLSLSSNLDKNFYLLSSTTSKYYYNNFSRLCSNTCILELNGVEKIDNLGAFIDVFPLDNVPNDKNERLIFYSEIKKAKEDILYSLPVRYYSNCSFRKSVKYIFNLPRRIRCRYIIGTEVLKTKRDDLMKKYKNHDVGLYADLFDYPDDNLIVKSTEIQSATEFIFEDIKVNVPNGYENILQRLYGDYMKLPDEKDRVSHHHFIPYWNNV